MADWAVHIFREHNKEADFRAGKGVKGRKEDWTDTANVVWSEVTGLCGFWDGSCERGMCGCRGARLSSHHPTRQQQSQHN